MAAFERIRISPGPGRSDVVDAHRQTPARTPASRQHSAKGPAAASGLPALHGDSCGAHAIRMPPRAAPKLTPRRCSGRTQWLSSATGVLHFHDSTGKHTGAPASTPIAPQTPRAPHRPTPAASPRMMVRRRRPTGPSPWAHGVRDQLNRSCRPPDRGRNSTVECQPSKLNVAGSSPVARCCRRPLLPAEIALLLERMGQSRPPSRRGGAGWSSRRIAQQGSSSRRYCCLYCYHLFAHESLFRDRRPRGVRGRCSHPGGGKDIACLNHVGWPQRGVTPSGGVFDGVEQGLGAELDLLLQGAVEGGEGG